MEPSRRSRGLHGRAAGQSRPRGKDASRYDYDALHEIATLGPVLVTSVRCMLPPTRSALVPIRLRTSGVCRHPPFSSHRLSCPGAHRIFIVILRPSHSYLTRRAPSHAVAPDDPRQSTCCWPHLDPETVRDEQVPSNMPKSKSRGLSLYYYSLCSGA